MLKNLKNIFKNTLIKKILGFLIAFCLGSAVFSVGGDCYAQATTENPITTQESVQKKLTDFNDVASDVIRLCYALLRPILFVCGIAMDNSMIYGERFHLDVSLLTIRNITKNIANFALAFLVVLSILLNMFGGKIGKLNLKPKDVITKTLVAGILIQMSRFLPAAILDISTILTYSVGGLPLTVLNQNPEFKDRPILGVNADFSIEGNQSNIDYYYTYGDHKIAECYVYPDDSNWKGDRYIVGPKKIYMSGWIIDTGYCMYNGRPYQYNHSDDLYPPIVTVTGSLDEANANYKNNLVDGKLKTGLNDSGVKEQRINQCIILPVKNSKIPNNCVGALSLTGNDPFFNNAGGSNTFTLNNLIGKSKNKMLGPLITIYSSLLDVQSLTNFSSSDDYLVMFADVLFKLFFLVILVLPLVALAIVLIMRVLILQVVIAAAPLLVLIWVYQGIGTKIQIIDLSKIGSGIFGFGNVIKLVFAPVIVVFAISMSMVLLTALSNMGKGDPVRDEEILNEMSIERKDKTYSFFGGLIELELNIDTVNRTFDDIAYFITMLFATGVVRFILMAAVKACGKTGKTDWGDKLQKLGQGFAGGLPIIPLPNGAVGVGALAESLPKIGERSLQKLTDKSRDNLPDFLKTEEDRLRAGQKNDVANSVIADIKGGKITKYSDLSDEQRTALSTYYGTNSTDTQKLIESMINYNSDNNKQTREKIQDAGKSINSGSGETLLDPMSLSSSELEQAVQNDDNWIRRASSRVGSGVITQDGLYIIDVIEGTEKTSQPIYRIIERSAYEQEHFGSKIDNLEQQRFEEIEKDDKKNEKMKKHLDELENSYKKYLEIKDKDENSRNENEKTIFDKLSTIFTDDFLTKLRTLAEDKFKEETTGQN